MALCWRCFPNFRYSHIIFVYIYIYIYYILYNIYIYKYHKILLLINHNEYTQILLNIGTSKYWLVASTPLKNISQWEGLSYRK